MSHQTESGFKKRKTDVISIRNQLLSKFNKNINININVNILNNNESANSLPVNKNNFSNPKISIRDIPVNKNNEQIEEIISDNEVIDIVGIDNNDVNQNLDLFLEDEGNSSNLDENQNTLTNLKSKDKLTSEELTFLTDLKFGLNDNNQEFSQYLLSQYEHKHYDFDYEEEENNILFSDDIEEIEIDSQNLDLDDYVLLPHDKENFFSFDQKTSKWEVIETALSQKILNSYDFEKKIIIYNKEWSGKWKFDCFHQIFQKQTHSLFLRFFNNLCPKIQKLALRIPEIFSKKKVPLLKNQIQKTVLLSQEEIACLLANAFFCTFPKRNFNNYHSIHNNNHNNHNNIYKNFPSINFNSLFEGPMTDTKVSKMLCILNYFDRVTTTMPTGNVSFHRRVISRFPIWKKSEKKLSRIDIRLISSGTIEDLRDRAKLKELLEIDFANSLIGGGVLGRGCVQEEIRFLLSPELIISRLFSAKLEQNEGIVMTGSERFNSCEGYSNTFSFLGNFFDQTPFDKYKRKLTKIVAMDAIDYSKIGVNQQFTAEKIERELNKVYLCFLIKNPLNNIPIATGNWGCGAFKGDLQLKAIIQIMAAIETERDILYCLFDEFQLQKSLKDFLKLFVETQISNRHLWSCLIEYCERRKYGEKNILEYIQQRFIKQ